MPSRSTCTGEPLRFGVRSTQPLSLAPAVALDETITSVIVTKTWLKGPAGAAQVVGSLTCRLTVAIEEGIGLLLLVPHPASTMAAMVAMPVTTGIRRRLRFIR